MEGKRTCKAGNTLRGFAARANRVFRQHISIQVLYSIPESSTAILLNKYGSYFVFMILGSSLAILSRANKTVFMFWPVWVSYVEVYSSRNSLLYNGHRSHLWT